MREKVTHIHSPDPDGGTDDGSNRVKALHAAHDGPLRAYLRRMGVNRTDIDDLTQETWARLLRRSDNLTGVDHPRAWLFTVALNVFRDRMRQQKKHDHPVDFDERLWPSPMKSPESTVIDRESLDRVQRSITDLPDQTRRIFLLSRFEELTYPEIAQKLDVSTRTVERHIARAMSVLRQNYERE